MKSRKCPDGFGLVDVMVALGVSSILIYGLMSVTKNSMKAQNNVKLTADADNLASLLSLQLSSPATCAAALAIPTSSTNPSPNKISSSNNASTTANFNTSYAAPPSSSPYTMQFVTGSQAVTAPGYNNVLLQITFQKAATGATNLNFLGASNIVRTLPIQVTVDNSYNVTACTTAGSGSACWGFANGALTETCGNVGIGVSSPQASLQTNGQIVPGVYNNGSGTSFDFNNGNIQYTSASCQAMTLANLLDGGSYMIGVTGAVSGTCTFSSSGLNFLWTYNGPTSAASSSIFSFQRMGTNVFVSWMTGFH